MAGWGSSLIPAHVDLAAAAEQELLESLLTPTLHHDVRTVTLHHFNLPPRARSVASKVLNEDFLAATE